MNYELKCKFLKFTITDTMLIQNLPKIKIKISEITGLSYKEATTWMDGEIRVSAKPIPMIISFRPKDNDLAKKIYNELKVATKGNTNELTGIDLFLNNVKRIPNSSDIGTGNVIIKLPDLLSKDEVVKAYAPGDYQNDKWLLVCTNKRILLLNGGAFSPLKTKAISLSSITSISQNSGLVNGTLEIIYGSSTISISDIPAIKLTHFIQQVNLNKDSIQTPVVSSAPARTTVTPQKVAPSVSVADEILKFKSLLDAGALTQEEYDAKKKQLLGL